MAPKRAKAAAQSSSQPLPAGPPATRGTRKRRYSDGSNVSSVVSETPSSSQVPKRRKKGKQVAASQPEPEVIIEEDEQVVEDVAPTTIAEVVEDGTVDAHGERHVHFSSSQQDTAEEQTTASHITPHPRKMTVKRRYTLSPGEGTESRRIKTTRTSLPASLSQDGGTATTIIRELQFSTLRAVLEERIRRLKEHQKSGHAIDSDMLDDLLVLESQEEGVKYPTLPSPSLSSKALQVVSTPSKSTPSAFSRFRSFLGKVDTTTSTTEDVSQSDIIENKVRASLDNERRTWEAERARFQDAILALSHEAEEAKARLRILTIELESFGFSEGTSANVILQSIRESFESVRELFESELFGSLADDASFKDIVELLITNIKEFVGRLRVQDKELREKDDVITDLSGQVNGLLDHLAQVELRKSTVEQQWRELDQENEEKSRSIEELEEELALLREERDSLQAELTERSSELEVLVVEKTEFEQTIDRLSASLQSYRDEEARLTALITRMESDHSLTVASMNRERQETVQDLEDRLDAEIAKRGDAEKVSNDLRVTITKLESRVETIIIERDTLTETLVTVRAQRDVESGEKENVQADLEERDALIGDLEGRVGKLEEELSELNIELEELRRTNESERTQRERAEQDLDDRNVEIEELNEKLRHSGQQANELRQKLFEVQQNNTHTVERLETEMIERDEQFQADMAAEVERREVTDKLAQERSLTIITIETRLKEVEEQMRLLIIEKDIRIAELDAIIIERDTDIQNLEEDLRAAEDRLDEANETHRERVEDLETNISTLKTTITTHERTIRTLEQDSATLVADHSTELEDRDTVIADLNVNITDLRVSISQLETQRTNLERRVEDEAEAMLAFQTAKADEIDALNAALRDKQDKILIVQEKAQQADARWQEVLEARDEALRLREEEFLALQSEQEITEETLESFTTQNLELKAKFEAYVSQASGLIGRLQDALAAARAAVDEEGAAFLAEGQGLLEEVAGMASFSQTQTATHKKVSKSIRSVAAGFSASQAQSASAVGGKKGGRSSAAAGGGRKKRTLDSGIGLAQPEMEEVE